MPRIHIWMPDTLDAMLPRGMSRSGGIASAVDRYVELCKRTPVPAFTDAEWALLREALHGTAWQPAANISTLWHRVEDAIGLNDLGAAHPDVNTEALLAQLKNLTYAEALKIVATLEAEATDRAG
ncbi:MAG: hypothetical protein AAF909_12850 [Pseudomonadota bacterium]